MGVVYTKAAARRFFLKQREACGEQAVLDLSESILRPLKTLSLERYEQFHLFLSMVEKKEVQTAPIMEWLWHSGKKTIVPKADFKTRSLSHFFYTPQTPLARSTHGIAEPLGAEPADVQRIDVILVPLVAFDKRGNRVGYGAGFYDRFLRSCRPDSLKIGLSLFEPIDRILDTDAYDFPLTHCVTPYKSYCFAR